jgi:hypothetical protein
MDRVKAGDVLVTDMTDPNWEPVMKRAAIVTNRGGRTCHAAIIARELGIPAIVGCGNATEVLSENETSPSPAPKATPATSTRQARLRSRHHRHRQPADIPVKIMMNVGNPELAFEFAQIPNAGVGLARLEFIINNMIGIHPKAILEINQVPASLRAEIRAAPRLRHAEAVLRREAGRRRRHHRRGLLPEARHRAPVRLQVQRVPQAARRRDLRAGRRKPDAGLPRRLPLHRPQLPRLLRDGMRRDEEGAQRNGPDQRAADGALRA